MIVIALLDRKTGFDNVSVVINEEVAKRGFGYAINNGDIPSYAPADFELYKLGDFEPKNGRITVLDIPELLCTGQEMIGK